MFQFSGFATLCLTVFNCVGCPIRTSTDQGSFAPPRRFSQLTTSFVASGSQGIPHAPFVRFHLFDKNYEFVTSFRRSVVCFYTNSVRLTSQVTLLYFTRLFFYSLPLSLSLRLPPSLVNELFTTFMRNTSLLNAQAWACARTFTGRNGNHSAGLEPDAIPLDRTARLYSRASGSFFILFSFRRFF